MNNNLLKKPNQAIMITNVHISVLQRKVYNSMLFYAQKVLNKNPNENQFLFSISELKKIAGLKATDNWHLKNDMEKLVNIKLETIGNNGDWGFFRLISEVRKKGDLLQIELPSIIREALINNNFYTTLDLLTIKSLTGKYAVIFYEMAIRYKGVSIPKFTIEEFRKFTGTEVYEENGKEKNKTYNNFNNLRIKVIEPALKEIEEKTNIKLTYNTKTLGRKTISIIFKALYKHEIYDKNLKKEIEKVENKIDFEIENVKSFEDIPKPIKKKVVKINKEYSEEVLKLFEILPLEEQIESSKEKLENLLKDHTFKYIESDIKYAKKSKVKNYWAFLLKSCKEGHYSKDEIEKAKIPAEEKNTRLKKTKEMIEKIEEDKLKIEEQNKLREKALEFYENLNEDIKEKIKEKAKELYIQEGQIKDFNPMIKKIYETTLEKFYIHRIMRENFKGLLEI